MHQSAGDFQAAAHSAGEHFHRFVGPFFQIDFLEQLFDGPQPFFAGDAVELGENAHVFHRAQIEVGGHRLGNDADGLAHVVGVRGRCRSR